MQEKNYAFIDGQNLHLGIKECGWSIDHTKFRNYLLKKYNVSEAYYFLGFVSEKEQDLYDKLQKAGFILFFREHTSILKGRKKGNVDSDIVFSIMRKMVDEKNDFNKILIVSGDGDYIKLVNYLIKKDKFKKMLFPNKKFASSLYNQFGSEFYDYLESKDVKNKVEYKKEKGSLGS